MSRDSLMAAVSPSRAVSFLDEFKNFALKGNVIDLAVAVIIGTAFTRVVDSLVKNLIMPLASLVMPSQQSYLGWKITVGSKQVPYGFFIGDVVSFLMVALVVFIFLVKFIGWLTKAGKKQAEESPPLTVEQQLLTEIRDLLKTGHVAGE